jgi:type IV pilus assembly protein PilP
MQKVKFMIMNSVVIVIFSMATLFAFAADIKPAPAAANAVKSAPAAANVPAQTQEKPAAPEAGTPGPNAIPVAVSPPPVEDYKYEPFGKPDPFQPFIVIEAAAKKKAEKKGATSIYPLQRAEADSYRVVGIAGTDNHRVAIVEDASKKFYPLVKGTRIGLYDGKVIEIAPDRVVVEEYEDRRARKIILRLHKN